jgi:hypothetical protein
MTEKTVKKTAKKSATGQPGTQAVLSLIFGIVSFLGPGLFLGIPAIVLAGIALRKDTSGRGLSIAGMILGVTSTVLSVVFILIIAWLIAWATDHPEEFYEETYPYSEQYEQPETPTYYGPHI